MLSLYRFFFSLFTTLSIVFTSLFSPVQLKTPSENFDFSFLEYPAQSVKTLEESGLTEEILSDRARDSNGGLYLEAQGYDDVSGIVVSPYYKAKIAGKEIPVYAATVFLGSTQAGALHSFSEIYVEKGSDFTFNIEIISDGYQIRNAIVLPESLGVGVSCKNGTATASISDFGIYTFLFNGAEQEHAFTLFVREKVDEDDEIRSLIEQYGEENVTVFEKGVHRLDYLNFKTDNSILYLKNGAHLIANHKYDIMSEDDELLYVEQEALTSNAIGLTRMPFINFFNCKNVKILGSGAIDLSSLDRRERRGIVFNFCNGIEVRGVKIFNCPEWSFITYQCENVDISETDIFGYKQNADAYAICNSRNVTVADCFARTGDDLFDVKALGGAEPAMSKNIVFSGCVAWAGKARCFGICGEVNREISNVTFKDCAVIYKDATWDNERIASLAIIVEIDDGFIDNVLFENIEIFCDDGRAIGCRIYEDEIEDFSATNITFRNITYTSRLPAGIAAANETNTVDVTIENVTANGRKINSLSSPLLDVDKFASVEVK